MFTTFIERSLETVRLDFPWENIHWHAGKKTGRSSGLYPGPPDTVLYFNQIDIITVQRETYDVLKLLWAIWSRNTEQQLYIWPTNYLSVKRVAWIVWSGIEVLVLPGTEAKQYAAVEIESVVVYAIYKTSISFTPQNTGVAVSTG